MVQVTYPGVYIQEIPSSVRTIKTVSTSVAAFIDFFREGPMNEAVQIFGMTDFDRVFGGLDSRSAASYAIAQFFLNGGSEAYVVRVNRDRRSTPPAAGDLPLETARVAIKSDVGAGPQVLEVAAANPGVWGNTLRVDVDRYTEAPATTFNLTITRYDRPAADARPLAVERFLNLTMTAGPRYVVSVVNDESQLARVRHLTFGTPNAGLLPAVNGTVGGDISGLTPAQRNSLSGSSFDVSVGGATITATFETWAAGAVATPNQVRARLETAIRTAGTVAGNAIVASASVQLLNGNQLVVTAGRSAAAYNSQHVVTIANNGAPNVATLLRLTGAPASANVQQYQLGLGTGTNTAGSVGGVAGADGDLPAPADILGSGAVEPHTGMLALDYVDIFNLLCIPRAADLSDTEMTSVISNAITYCEAKRAFLIVDIPESINEVQEMKDWLDAHAGFRHRNAAVYFPRPLIPDPKNEYRLRAVGASGTMAGIYARTDSARGVWKAPAGIEAILNGVSELAAKLTDPQNGTLNPLGINCLRTFPIYGPIAWGTRTLRGADQLADEWAYIPVRRLALMLEESLFRGTKWVVFEPNDEPLWAKIRLNVGAFMTSLFRQGAFQGTTPREAFYVKCDAETTTQNDRNQGIVNIEVGFAPLKPAEFVVIKIQQMAGEL
ncbi:MAG TPA: phage tail sheath C-terminal domain-containing protein [Pelomicrobium sp.]|nr:phage tail sheath C-terminal domain-containing protein [Pelomicrobium sp.]